MEFLVGDDTGLLKNVSTPRRCTYTYKAGQQDRKEAILSACWSSEEFLCEEVTVGRRSGVVEAFRLPAPPPSSAVASLQKAKLPPTSANPVQAPHYLPHSALSCALRPLRVLRMPAPCVQTSLVHDPKARHLLNASLRDALAADPYFSLFQCPVSSPLLPSTGVPAFASSSPQLFCIDQEGHACVVNWEGEFREHIEVSREEAPSSKKSDAAEAAAGTIRLKKTREDSSPEDADHTGAYVYEVTFPAVPAYRHPSPVSVSGVLRAVKRPRGVARVKQEDDSDSPLPVSACHVVAGWQLSGPVGCATPIHPLMPDRFAFGGKENEIKVFDICQGRYIWAAKNVRQTLLQLRVAVHPTSLAWLPSVHPFVLAAGTAKGAIRVFDLRCQRRPVYELENAVRGSHDVIEKRVISAMAAETIPASGPEGLGSILRACRGAPRNVEVLEGDGVKTESADDWRPGEKKRRKTRGGVEREEGDNGVAAAQTRAPTTAKKGGDVCGGNDEETTTTGLSEDALKMQVRRLYGREKAKLYFADSYGAVYVHTVLTEDALMRFIDGAVKKHNRTSCCTTLSEDDDEADGRAACRTKKRWADPRIRSKLLLAFQQRKQQKLSSRKNASRLCCSPINGPQYTTVFAGGFQGAVGAILALAEDASGRYLVGVGYGRHAYVWRTYSRKLAEKVYLKQKLLTVLPSRKAVAGETRPESDSEEGSDGGKNSQDESTDGSSDGEEGKEDEEGKDSEDDATEDDEENEEEDDSEEED
ncbi:hypothetical protein TGP89_225360 [Toxoplasma gondii p89]|uniref:Uncharacterized protein n=1 Tax=Toxoplasma gondii p89 TaxID=943119 RepID=A0A086KES2_TOXGO|nr:hypothetical protein TGP89_225360 [Toxoplasma gondii p89]